MVGASWLFLVLFWCTRAKVLGDGWGKNYGKGVEVMDWEDRIVVDPKILVGKPVIKGTRIAVEHIIDLLAAGWSLETILNNYPQLKREDIAAALKYAAEILKQEKVYPLP